MALPKQTVTGPLRSFGRVVSTMLPETPDLDLPDWMQDRYEGIHEALQNQSDFNRAIIELLSMWGGGKASAVSNRSNPQRPELVTINLQTGLTYALVESDCFENVMVERQNDAANLTYIPSGVFPVRANIVVVQVGEGESTIKAGPGVTLNGNLEGTISCGGKYGAISLYQRTPNNWIGVGGSGFDVNDLSRVVLNTQTGVSYTFVPGDAQYNTITERSNPAANVTYIPPSMFTVRDTLVLVQTGEGESSIQAAPGVYLNGVEQGSVSCGGKSGAVSLYQRDTNEWISIGGSGFDINELARIKINSQTGLTYTLIASDANYNTTLERDNPNPNLTYIPADTFTLRDTIIILQVGAGVSTIKAMPGVYLNGVEQGEVNCASQFDGVSIYQRTANHWIAIGGE